MSSPDRPHPDEPGSAPFTPPSEGRGPAGAGVYPPPDGSVPPGDGPYARPEPTRGQAPYGSAGPYQPGGVPWEAQSGRRGLSGGKIALIVVAALVAVAVLLVGALVLARGLAGGGVPFSGDAPFAYGDDAVLDELWDRCEGGDGEACDDLFWDSPVDSEYEEFGNTCGGRFEDGPWSCEQEL